jgi:hypothetical protein
MTTYVLINDIGYRTDTEAEIATVKRALREEGVPSAKVFAGADDGSGDSYENGQILFAEEVRVRELATGRECTFVPNTRVLEVPPEVVADPAAYGGEYHDDVVEEEEVTELGSFALGTVVAIRDPEREDDERGAMWPRFEVIG